MMSIAIGSLGSDVYGLGTVGSMDGVDLDRVVGSLGCVQQGASRLMNGNDLGLAVGTLGCVSEGR
jgi:hypothetical protein